MGKRELQVSQKIAQLAGEFFAREGGVKALITVTHADIAPNFKNATIYLSVLPNTHESEVIKFAKRSRSDFREYMKEHSFFHPVPIVDFEIDYGEKNRQRIDQLTRKDIS